MVCLPGQEPNQFDLFDPNINFASEPSTVYPPNMKVIMDELAKPDAFAASVNLSVVDDSIAALDAMTAPQLAALPTESQQLINGTYDFAGDSLFNQYTSNYNTAFPPLISNGDITGIPTSIPGAVGSLGQANILRSFGTISSGNGLQRHLGLGAIPDCGITDKLLGLLSNLLQPLIDLLANLSDPLFNLILATSCNLVSSSINDFPQCGHFAFNDTVFVIGPSYLLKFKYSKKNLIVMIDMCKINKKIKSYNYHG